MSSKFVLWQHPFCQPPWINNFLIWSNIQNHQLNQRVSFVYISVPVRQIYWLSDEKSTDMNLSQTHRWVMQTFLSQIKHCRIDLHSCFHFTFKEIMLIFLIQGLYIFGVSQTLLKIGFPQVFVCLQFVARRTDLSYRYCRLNLPISKLLFYRIDTAFWTFYVLNSTSVYLVLFAIFFLF